MMKRAWLPLLLLPLLLTGCIDVEGEGLVYDIFREIGKTKILDLVWDSVLYAVLGGFLGAALGLITFFGMRAIGAYTWNWKHAWLFRGLTALIVVAGFGASGAAVGLLQGFLKGTERVLRESQLATEVFPTVGNVGADFTFALAVVSEQVVAAPAAADSFELPHDDAFQAFTEGKRECDIVGLLGRTQDLPETLGQDMTKSFIDDLLADHPAWKGTKLQTLSEQMVGVLVGYLIKQKAGGGLEGVVGKVPGGEEAARVAARVLNGLAAAAASQGDANTMSRAELSEYFVQQGLVPVSLIPVKKLVRGKQTMMLVFAVLAIVIPIPCFLLAEFLRKRMGGDEPPEDGAPAPAPEASAPGASPPVEKSEPGDAPPPDAASEGPSA